MKRHISVVDEAYPGSRHEHPSPAAVTFRDDRDDMKIQING